MDEILKGIKLLSPGKPAYYLFDTPDGDKVVGMVMKLIKKKDDGVLSISVTDGIGSGGGLVN